MVHGVRGSTGQACERTSSRILAKRRDTSLPLSLNHLLNRLCAFTSISCACGNLRMHGLQSFLGALWVHVQSTPYHT